jgi:hypothetical protein
MSEGKKKINACKELTIKINEIVLFSKPMMVIKIGHFTGNRTAATCSVSKHATARTGAVSLRSVPPFQRLTRKTVNNVKK